MLRDLDVTKLDSVYIVCGYTDLRNGIDGLCGVLANKYGHNPFEGKTLYLFCGRNPRKIKGLIWEGDGFLLLYKRLESGKFKWPRTREEVMALSPKQIKWLLEGLSIYQKNSIDDVYPRKCF